MRKYIQKNLCQKFCSYYKPSKKENIACKGFLVIEKLLKRGSNIPFDKTYEKPGDAIQGELIREMCIACSFYENGCDFVQKKKDAPPCGGFMLSANLLEKNIISIDDIQNII
ncbi:MAG: hypothetical protein FJ240_02735 [Nitrospira sp.]|nr:hypothetical protein [Nitrospira sp.]